MMMMNDGVIQPRANRETSLYLGFHHLCTSKISASNTIKQMRTIAGTGHSADVETSNF